MEENLVLPWVILIYAHLTREEYPLLSKFLYCFAAVIFFSNMLSCCSINTTVQ